MSLVLVSIPHDQLIGTQHVWLPFVEKIARRTRNSVDELSGQIASGEIQIHLAWHPIDKRAHALAGTRLFLRGGCKVAELVWCTGDGRKHWLPLLDEMEAHHRAIGCVGMNALARFGWMRELKERGYRATHVMLEKDFTDG